jgi:O-antigen ligase
MSQPSNTQSLAIKLARHLAMGGLLGTVLAVLLVAMNVRNILGLISLSASPLITGMLFVSVIALLCAVGATLTGLIFILTDDENA